MMNWNDIVMYQERHKDYVREAARERLIRQARAGHPEELPFLAHVTAWLEQHLENGLRKPHRTLAGSSRA